MEAANPLTGRFHDEVNTVEQQQPIRMADQEHQKGETSYLFVGFVYKNFISEFRNLSSARPHSTRPPSALSGGTATRLTSAMHNINVAAASQRIGTSIGFADNVSGIELQFG